MKEISDKLSTLFRQWAGRDPDNIMILPASGSQRRYFRLLAGHHQAIGAWNPVIEENRAFLYFSRQFKKQGLAVPEIYAEDLQNDIYLIEDLGDTSLFSMVEKLPVDTAFPEDIVSLYKKCLSELVKFQVMTSETLDFSYCYPYHAFDARSMKWDLDYFKYYFLKLHVDFHEDRLENDFLTLIRFLEKAGSAYFMYRDFQSRNIFIREGRPHFIDYQGGRKGPLQYDVASLLFQVKAGLPFEVREELLSAYLEELEMLIRVNKDEFRAYYDGFVLLRLLQVLGAYGFRGIIGKKPHFMTSIPYALKNLNWWLNNVRLPMNLPELTTVLEQLAVIDKYLLEKQIGDHRLRVTIKSFSYRTGIPDDISGNGGGYVFDCRALPNPGREERYRVYTGKDTGIIDYLKDEPAVLRFLDEAEKMLSLSIDNYLERGFSNLAANFGCTGGRHRSVYCAETIAKRLQRKYPDVDIHVEHTNI